MRTKVTEKSFNGQSFYVGIDHHKKRWVVTILGEHIEHKVMSQNPDPDLLASYLKKNFPGGTFHAVYEAGFSGFESCRRLQELGINCIVIHPADVPTTRKEKLQKTDKGDSRKLARQLRGRELEALHIPDHQLEADRVLIRHRFRLVKDIARTKNRVKSLLFQLGIPIPDRFTSSQTRYWSRPYINWLKELEFDHESLRHTLDSHIRIGELLRKELLEINKQIKSLSQTAPYVNNYNLLISIPGIGITIAMVILTQIADISRFKNLDHLCNYVGLVPSMYSSGDKMRTGKMIKRGRKEIKIMLIEAAWHAIRSDPSMMAKYNELKKRMDGNKAIIRIARKMLSRIRYVLLNQKRYELSIVK